MLHRSDKRKGSGIVYIAQGDPGQTVFILLDEPESSTVAKLTSIYMQVRDFDVPTRLGVPAHRTETNLRCLMQLLIFASSVIFITETLPSIRADPKILDTFHVSCVRAPHSKVAPLIGCWIGQVMEWICILHFTVDYATRIATCTRRPSHDKGLWSYAKQVRPQHW